MPKSYEAIVTALKTVKDIKLDFVKDRLLGEEKKRKKDTNVVNHKIQSAFLCFGCGKPGHKMYQCPGRRHIGNTQYNPGQPGTSRYQNSGERQERKNYSRRGRGRDQSYHRGRGNKLFIVENVEEDKTVFMCNEPAEVNKCETYVSSIQWCVDSGCSNHLVNNKDYFKEFIDSIQWCVDSGCSNHLVNNKDYFKEFIELSNTKKICAAKNGVMLEAIGIGNIEVKCLVNNVTRYCIIKNVYYVPELRKNLLSVSKMEQNGLKVIFSERNVKVYKGSKIIMTGNNNGSLYSIDMELDIPRCNYSANKVNKDQVELWYRRYGRLSVNNINKLVRDNLVNGYCFGGYKLWDEDKNRIVAARNIIFDERLHKQEEEVSISSKPIEESDNDMDENRDQENNEGKVSISSKPIEESDNDMDENRDQENNEGKENIEEEIISRNKPET
ncbi:hypothetical protein QE152_g25159 [Popillia japonica]|uniref:CCHC-type domain-containing protein n=1 Tax=Popillia japonica TaxID=7064 RepID=A0AAW1K2H8_POPJA